MHFQAPVSESATTYMAEGSKDYNRKLTVEQNPYQEKTQQNYYWQMGWRAAWSKERGID